MKKRFFLIIILILSLLAIVCIFAPYFSSYDPNKVDLRSIDNPPSKEHILGCDSLGRDIYSRVLYGGRVSIAVGFAVALIQLTIGVSFGMTAGYYGGWIDIVMMKFAEMIQCFPFFILAISMVSLIGEGFWSVVIILGILGWPSIFLVIRAETLKLRDQEYILAAKVLGAGRPRILVKHIFPHVTGLMLVQVTLSISSAILSESSLSFLGMGVAPPHSSWGNILMAARTMSVLQNNWWQWLPAGLCIFFVVLSVNVLGKGMYEER
ncbi:MAG: ABC transporter permease [Firmicutes bacterium]|jgi:peptide/nickel transport system permease protein|nr:ABC transporter permease [Bacillota bacterium]